MVDNLPEATGPVQYLDAERPEVNDFLPQTEHESASRAFGSAQASSEVLGAIFAAKKFPRDEFKSFQKVITACQRINLANAATYMYPKGGTNVTGPSIRLAEVLAQAWGNMDYGIRELEQHEGYSEMQAYCWDLETNLQRKINFTVKHERHTRQGSYALEDPRDIYELTANQGARRMRSCILAQIPADVTEKAVAMCKQTIAKGGGEPLVDLIKKMLLVFGQLGVTQAMIEQKLGHPIGEMSPEEYADYRSICNTVRDNAGSRDQFFTTTASSKPVISSPKPKTTAGARPQGQPTRSQAPAITPAKAREEPKEDPKKEVVDAEIVDAEIEQESDIDDLSQQEAGPTFDTGEPENAEPAQTEEQAQPELTLRPPAKKTALPGAAATVEPMASGPFQIEASKRVAMLGWNAELLSRELQKEFGLSTLIEVPVKQRVLVLSHLKNLLKGRSG